MRSSPSPALTRALLIALSLSIASGCATPAAIPPAFPPAADLLVRPEPIPPPEAFESDAAARLYDARRDAWAREGWAAVARLCRFHQAMGMQVACE